MKRVLVVGLSFCLAAPAVAQMLSADPGVARDAESINRTNNDIARTDGETGMSAGQSLINGGMSRSQRLRAAKRAEERKAKRAAERAGADAAPQD